MRNRIIKLSRYNRFEALEPRCMLSASATVVDVNLASTAWSSDFIDHLESSALGAGGFSIEESPLGLAPLLPWGNLDQIKITFSEDVNVYASDLSVSGVAVTAYEFADFTYDPQAMVATWTLANDLGNDRLFIDLDRYAFSPWQDSNADPPGEKGVKGKTVSKDDIKKFDQAETDFELRFDLLPGDADASGVVDTTDQNDIAANEGAAISDADYSVFQDLDGSGAIDSLDTAVAIAHLWETLPSGDPVGLTNDAPTTSGFNHLDIDDAAVDVAVALYAGFRDQESADADLSYTVVENTNAGLFETVSVDGASAELFLNAADGASGRSKITIRATDEAGLFVDSALYVDVDYENQPPQIDNAYATSVGPNTWIVQGWVSDADDDTTSWIVEFTGEISTRAFVRANGMFEFGVVYSDAAWGLVQVLAEDQHGDESNTFNFFIGFGG